MTPQVKARFGSESEEPLPDSPGIYFLCKNAEIVYIGKTISVAQRVESHRGIKDFDSVLLLRTPEELLNSVEIYWIKRLRPPLNQRSIA
jgi:excinuclease UvrABC nuclease subunit